MHGGVGWTSFDHTGDVAVSIDAPDLPGLFRDAALAFTATITGLDEVRQAVEEPVDVAAESLDDLMVEWLGELLYRFEVRHLLVCAADLEVAGGDAGWRATGVVRGETFDPSRHRIQVLVKGITYHRLHVVRDGSGWRTDVVFDI